MPEIAKTIVVQAVDTQKATLVGEPWQVKALFDTGTTSSIISAELAKQLRIKTFAGTVQVLGVAGAAEGKQAVVAISLLSRDCAPRVTAVTVVQDLLAATGYSAIVGLAYQDTVNMVLLPVAREVTCNKRHISTLLESLKDFEDDLDQPKSKTKSKPSSKRRAQRTRSKR